MKTTTKSKIEKNLSPMQKLFANAIDYKALNKALKDEQVLKILAKLK